MNFCRTPQIVFFELCIQSIFCFGVFKVKYSRKLSEIIGGHVEISSENRAKWFGGKSGFNMSLL